VKNRDSLLRRSTNSRIAHRPPPFAWTNALAQPKPNQNITNLSNFLLLFRLRFLLVLLGRRIYPRRPLQALDSELLQQVERLPQRRRYKLTHLKQTLFETRRSHYKDQEGRAKRGTELSLLPRARVVWFCQLMTASTAHVTNLTPGSDYTLVGRMVKSTD
jgi:hypothetical protein